MSSSSSYLLSLLLLVALVMCHGMVLNDDIFIEEDSSASRQGGIFMLHSSQQIVKTEAGEMKLVRSPSARTVKKPIHIGFLNMEPQTLYVPQYTDSSLILFVHSGEARVGSVSRNRLSERKLKAGDIYHIQSGSTFYLENTNESNELRVICSVDQSESFGMRSFQSFFIGGGLHPSSVLSGFSSQTLASAFNVSQSEVHEMMNRQRQGAIVYVHSHSSSLWSKFTRLEEKERLQKLKDMTGFQPEEEETEEEEEEEETSWSWRKLLGSVFGSRVQNRNVGNHEYIYNIYDRTPDFKNNYGFTVAVDKSDYKPLKHSGIGVYLVNLTAGSMLAPHLNPSATEYGVILKGSGHIQIVYPNGTSAMNARVKPGDVFWVPRYFAFCQIAAESSNLEFFGFTTSARKNSPQFLVGSNSLLHTLPNEELAEAFSVSEERLERFTGAQSEAVILPTSAHHNEKKQKKKKVLMRKHIASTRAQNFIKTFGDLID